jgi:two-component system, OmpR family, phosphate regulon response regulator PhoB
VEQRQVIVVVDDHPGVNLALKLLLTRAAFTVVVATTALEGLALVHEHQPHLVISDVEMPGMSGLELASRLRSDNRTRAIPIVLITGNAQPTDLSNVDALVRKPFDNAELVGVVRELLANEKRPTGEEPDA